MFCLLWITCGFPLAAQYYTTEEPHASPGETVCVIAPPEPGSVSILRLKADQRDESEEQLQASSFIFKTRWWKTLRRPERPTWLRQKQTSSDLWPPTCTDQKPESSTDSTSPDLRGQTTEMPRLRERLCLWTMGFYQESETKPDCVCRGITRNNDTPPQNKGRNNSKKSSINRIIFTSVRVIRNVWFKHLHVLVSSL